MGLSSGTFVVSFIFAVVDNDIWPSLRWPAMFCFGILICVNVNVHIVCCVRAGESPALHIRSE